jgi:hypothetical protein
MSFRVTVSAAGLAVVISLSPAQAGVLSVTSVFAIDGTRTMSDAPIEGGDVGAASEGEDGVDFELQSEKIFSTDTSDLQRRTLAVTVVPQLPTWATTLLSLTGFSR